MTKSRPPPRTSRSPDAIDLTVARNIRRLRVATGMSQAALGAHVGVTYQQIQKYEDGTDRIAAARLYRCARALNVPVDTLYEEESEDA